MPNEKRKISKQKGVELCADLIFTGEATKEIVRNLTENYGVSRSAVEKWMKAARPLVEARQEESKKIMARENEAAMIESARKLNITRERVLEEYAKIAFFDIRKVLTVDGRLKNASEWDDESAAAIAGLESYDEKEPESGMILGTVRKIKVTEKRAALDSICKVMGYNTPEPIKENTVVIVKIPDNGRNSEDNRTPGGLPVQGTQ